MLLIARQSLACENFEMKRAKHAVFAVKEPARLIVPRNERGRQAVVAASLR